MILQKQHRNTTENRTIITTLSNSAKFRSFCQAVAKRAGRKKQKQILSNINQTINTGEKNKTFN